MLVTSDDDETAKQLLSYANPTIADGSGVRPVKWRSMTTPGGTTDGNIDSTVLGSYVVAVTVRSNCSTNDAPLFIVRQSL